ncbi:hypothetical protein ACKC9G_11670 [Pokkaliibacter sp. CJK22405]|uniref:hypothetical protein n=1 Tax=Pokkaliibacter sp. CJK22405 TaxID=3384615 RepID=UPI00398464AE
MSSYDSVKSFLNGIVHRADHHAHDVERADVPQTQTGRMQDDRVNVTPENGANLQALGHDDDMPHIPGEFPRAPQQAHVRIPRAGELAEQGFEDIPLHDSPQHKNPAGAVPGDGYRVSGANSQRSGVSGNQPTNESQALVKKQPFFKRTDIAAAVGQFQSREFLENERRAVHLPAFSKSVKELHDKINNIKTDANFPASKKKELLKLTEALEKKIHRVQTDRTASYRTAAAIAFGVANVGLALITLLTSAEHKNNQYLSMLIAGYSKTMFMMAGLVMGQTPDIRSFGEQIRERHVPYLPPNLPYTASAYNEKVKQFEHDKEWGFHGIAAAFTLAIFVMSSAPHLFTGPMHKLNNKLTDFMASKSTGDDEAQLETWTDQTSEDVQAMLDNIDGHLNDFGDRRNDFTNKGKQVSDGLNVQLNEIDEAAHNLEHAVKTQINGGEETAIAKQPNKDLAIKMVFTCIAGALCLGSAATYYDEPAGLIDLGMDAGLVIYEMSKTARNPNENAQQSAAKFASYSGLSPFLLPHGIINKMTHFTDSKVGLALGIVALTACNLTLPRPGGEMLANGILRLLNVLKGAKAEPDLESLAGNSSTSSLTSNGSYGPLGAGINAGPDIPDDERVVELTDEEAFMLENHPELANMNPADRFQEVTDDEEAALVAENNRRPGQMEMIEEESEPATSAPQTPLSETAPPISKELQDTKSVGDDASVTTIDDTPMSETASTTGEDEIASTGSEYHLEDVLRNYQNLPEELTGLNSDAPLTPSREEAASFAGNSQPSTPGEAPNLSGRAAAHLSNFQNLVNFNQSQQIRSQLEMMEDQAPDPVHFDDSIETIQVSGNDDSTASNQLRAPKHPDNRHLMQGHRQHLHAAQDREAYDTMRKLQSEGTPSEQAPSESEYSQISEEVASNVSESVYGDDVTEIDGLSEDNYTPGVAYSLPDDHRFDDDETIQDLNSRFEEMGGQLFRTDSNVSHDPADENFDLESLMAESFEGDSVDADFSHFSPQNTPRATPANSVAGTPTDELTAFNLTTDPADLGTSIDDVFEGFDSIGSNLDLSLDPSISAGATTRQAAPVTTVQASSSSSATPQIAPVQVSTTSDDDDDVLALWLNADTALNSQSGNNRGQGENS